MGSILGSPYFGKLPNIRQYDGPVKGALGDVDDLGFRGWERTVSMMVGDFLYNYGLQVSVLSLKTM